MQSVPNGEKFLDDGSDFRHESASLGFTEHPEHPDDFNPPLLRSFPRSVVIHKECRSSLLRKDDGFAFSLFEDWREVRDCVAVLNRHVPNPCTPCDLVGTRLAAAFHHQVIIDRLRHHQVCNDALEKFQASNPYKGNNWSSIRDDHTS
ncbi:MAG: hypothetical protein ACYSVY_04605 [Planctomycetota bacterium]